VLVDQCRRRLQVGTHNRQLGVGVPFEKARALSKGRFVLQTESPNGLILFGLRREVLEGKAAEPEEILAGLDAVTAEDLQRVAQDVIGGTGLSCALIGPFDDETVFEKVL